MYVRFDPDAFFPLARRFTLGPVGYAQWYAPSLLLPINQPCADDRVSN